MKLLAKLIFLNCFQKCDDQTKSHFQSIIRRHSSHFKSTIYYQNRITKPAKLFAVLSSMMSIKQVFKIIYLIRIRKLHWIICTMHMIAKGNYCVERLTKLTVNTFISAFYLVLFFYIYT